MKNRIYLEPVMELINISSDVITSSVEGCTGDNQMDEMDD